MYGLLLPVLLGILIGLSLGAIGGGGSILTVPILVYVIGQNAHAATATSLAIVGGTALAGAVPHWRAGRVALATAIPFGLAGIAGAFGGAYLNHLLSGTLILALFGGLMLLTALRMFLAPPLPDRTCATTTGGWSGWSRVLGAGLVVGLLTGFFGVGGGFLIVPALVLVLGFGMRAAVGTSLLIIALNSVSGLAAHLRYGGLDLRLTLVFTLGGVAGALLGARLAGRIDEQRLQRGFAVFIAALGAWLVFVNLPLA